MITKDDFTFCGNIPQEQYKEVKQESRAKMVFGKMLADKKTVAGMVIVLFLLIMSLVGPLCSKHSYSEIITTMDKGKEVTAYSIPPSLSISKDDPDNGMFAGETFIFGTDDLGRDLWTRTWVGTRVSLAIAFISILIDVLFGMSYGLISGYVGGRTDIIMQRITEIIKSIPNLVIISVLAVFMKKGIWLVIASLAITAWISMSRIARAEVLRMKNQEFIMASRTLGAKGPRIVFSDMLPNTTGPIMSQILISIPGAIFTEAFLSFVGVGIMPPACSIGSLIQSGFYSISAVPHLIVPPIVVLALLMIGFTFLGEGILRVLSEN